MRNSLVAIALATAFAGVPAAQAQTATTATREVYIKAQPTDVLSSNLIGLNVQNNAKENVGEIKDLVVSSGGHLSGIIVSVGGFLGIGERYVVVTPAAVKVVYSENDKKWSATMDTTKDALKAAPEFKYEGRWKR
ncbi:PRC-barrel domain-containing protein [Bosea sp. TAF32]|uniref:PRC-barrel domain-containing protein n=1 Tax=Bosea sp. TAF32 TaxID=3237482 RepID=UPI003F90F319